MKLSIVQCDFCGRRKEENEWINPLSNRNSNGNDQWFEMTPLNRHDQRTLHVCGTCCAALKRIAGADSAEVLK